MLPAGRGRRDLRARPRPHAGLLAEPRRRPPQALRDGWFHTGDVGHLDDDGWLFVVDRIKDLIIRNGFNVYPRDVEDVLLAHPDVASRRRRRPARPRASARRSSPSSRWPPAPTATPDELMALHCKEHISAAKYPREVRIVDAVPLTSVFKTDRKALRASW